MPESLEPPTEPFDQTQMPRFQLEEMIGCNPTTPIEYNNDSARVAIPSVYAVLSRIPQSEPSLMERVLILN
jgi:hypothetical protein